MINWKAFAKYAFTILILGECALVWIFALDFTTVDNLVKDVFLANLWCAKSAGILVLIAAMLYFATKLWDVIDK